MYNKLLLYDCYEVNTLSKKFISQDPTNGTSWGS